MSTPRQTASDRGSGAGLAMLLAWPTVALIVSMVAVVGAEAIAVDEVRSFVQLVAAIGALANVCWAAARVHRALFT